MLFRSVGVDGSSGDDIIDQALSCLARGVGKAFAHLTAEIREALIAYPPFGGHSAGHEENR